MEARARPHRLHTLKGNTAFGHRATIAPTDWQTGDNNCYVEGEAMAGRRVTDAEVERRIEQVLQWLSEGMPRRMIYDEVSRRYGVSNRQADDYMSRARKRLVAMFQENREEFVANQLAALEHLAHLATKGKQYSAAAGARATMARLTGTDQPRQPTVSKKNTGTDNTDG